MFGYFTFAARTLWKETRKWQQPIAALRAKQSYFFER
jgi:hypothetical protein